MIKKIITGLLIFALLSSSASACWVYLSMEELIEKSDLIIVGQIQLGTDRVKTSEKGYSNTKWTVDVCYILKGESTEKVSVITPGADGNTVETSIDYKLNEKGNNVLLFLTKDSNGDTYQPLSPQGIIGIQVNQDVDSKDLSLNQRLLAEYDFSTKYLEEKDMTTLLKFIEENKDLQIIEEDTSDEVSTTEDIDDLAEDTQVDNQKSKDNSYVILGASIMGVLLVSGILLVKSKKK